LFYSYLKIKNVLTGPEFELGLLILSVNAPSIILPNPSTRFVESIFL
jgi:hypothetical protein